MTDEKNIEYAVSAIRRFLHERPESADTLDGIHRWWIHWPLQQEASLTTLKALERLERLGEVRQLKLGTSILWRRCK